METESKAWKSWDETLSKAGDWFYDSRMGGTHIYNGKRWVFKPSIQHLKNWALEKVGMWPVVPHSLGDRDVD